MVLIPSLKSEASSLETSSFSIIEIEELETVSISSVQETSNETFSTLPKARKTKFLENLNSLLAPSHSVSPGQNRTDQIGI